MTRTFRVVEWREDLSYRRFGCTVLLESFTDKPAEAMLVQLAINGEKVPEMFRTVGSTVKLTIESTEEADVPAIVGGSS